MLRWRAVRAWGPRAARGSATRGARHRRWIRPELGAAGRALAPAAVRAAILCFFEVCTHLIYSLSIGFVLDAGAIISVVLD